MLTKQNVYDLCREHIIYIAHIMSGFQRPRNLLIEGEELET